MVNLDIEIVRDDRQSVVVELLDSDGDTVNPDDIGSIVMWVKPPFQAKLYPGVAVMPADPDNGLGRHLRITFTRDLLQRQMWTAAHYGIEVDGGENDGTTLIGGKITRIF